MKIRFAPTYINKDGMRTLARANQGHNHFDTREDAEKWLAAVLSNPNSDKRMWGDVSKMRVDAIECHDHGDALGIWINDDKFTPKRSNAGRALIATLAQLGKDIMVLE